MSLQVRVLIAVLLWAALLASCAYQPKTVAESFALGEAQYGQLVDKGTLWIKECSDGLAATSCKLTIQQAHALGALFDDYERSRDAALTAQALADDVDFSNKAAATLTILNAIRSILEPTGGTTP